MTSTGLDRIALLDGFLEQAAAHAIERHLDLLCRQDALFLLHAQCDGIVASVHQQDAGNHQQRDEDGPRAQGFLSCIHPNIPLVVFLASSCQPDNFLSKRMSSCCSSSLSFSVSFVTRR